MKPVIYKVKLSFYLLIAATILFTASCSKEKRVERSLVKKEGVWQIKKVVDWTQVINGTSGQSINNGTSENVGTMTFDKDGSGSYDYTINGKQWTGPFNWTVDKDNVSILHASQKIDMTSYKIEQVVVSFSGSKSSKDDFILEGSEIHQDVSSSIQQSLVEGTFYLGR